MIKDPTTVLVVYPGSFGGAISLSSAPACQRKVHREVFQALDLYDLCHVGGLDCERVGPEGDAGQNCVMQA